MVQLGKHLMSASSIRICYILGNVKASACFTWNTRIEELIRDLCQHFPELVKIVSDNYTYAKLALFIGPKERLSDTDLHELAAQLNEDSEMAQSIIDVAKVSMGQAVNLPRVPVK